jgi:hypothetical protein
MSDPPSNRGAEDAAASGMVEAFHRRFSPDKAAMVVFRPGDPPAAATLYSNAAAADLLPVLRAVLARIEAGALRMPTTADTVRWVKIEDAADGTET